MFFGFRVWGLGFGDSSAAVLRVCWLGERLKEAGRSPRVVGSILVAMPQTRATSLYSKLLLREIRSVHWEGPLNLLPYITL